MTAKELAARLGMTETGLSIAIGDNGNPPLKRLREIAAALGVEVADLFERRGDFIAFVRNHGETHTFDTPTALIEYADSLKGEVGTEAPAAPAASTTPSIFDDPIFR